LDLLASKPRLPGPDRPTRPITPQDLLDDHKIGR